VRWRHQGCPWWRVEDRVAPLAQDQPGLDVALTAAVDRHADRDVDRDHGRTGHGVDDVTDLGELMGPRRRLPVEFERDPTGLAGVDPNHGHPAPPCRTTL